MRTWLIGSDPGCDLVVAAPSVSSRHARLSESSGAFVLEDLGSTNGTFVNGRRIAVSTRVMPGDAISLGQAAPLPWPDLPPTFQVRTIRIGREPDNDVVIDAPGVSGHHARIVLEGDRATIEDLGSTNGTFLNSPNPDGQVVRAPLKGSDTVYLGSLAIPASRFLADLPTAPFPSPAPPASPEGPASLSFRGEAIVLGRDAECDHRVDRPMVSGRHARISRSAAGPLILEDLGSSNGSFVNGRRVEGSLPVEAGDLIGLGSYLLRLEVPPRTAPVLEPTSPDLEAPTAEAAPPPPILPGPSRMESIGSLIAERRADLSGTAVLILQAPVAAGLIALAFGGRSAADLTMGTWDQAARGITATTFAMGLASVWFGASDAVWSLALGRRPSAGRDATTVEPMAPGVAFLAILPLTWIQAGLMLGILSIAGRLEGPTATLFGLLALASGVGLALGLAIVAAFGTARRVVATLLLALIPLVLLGGLLRPAGAWDRPARLASSCSPTRWAFEGLLLVESDRRPTRRTPPESGPPADMAEASFPAESDRMGVRACVLAQVAMALGLIGLAIGLTPPRPD